MGFLFVSVASIYIGDKKYSNPKKYNCTENQKVYSTNFSKQSQIVRELPWVWLNRIIDLSLDMVMSAEPLDNSNWKSIGEEKNIYNCALVQQQLEVLQHRRRNKIYNYVICRLVHAANRI